MINSIRPIRHSWALIWLGLVHVIGLARSVGREGCAEGAVGWDLSRRETGRKGGKGYGRGGWRIEVD